jgi:hypothetical protein
MYGLSAAQHLEILVYRYIMYLHFKVVGKIYKEAMCRIACGRGRTIDIASGMLN